MNNGKLTNFNTWFKNQFGGLPNMHEAIELQELRNIKAGELESIVRQLEELYVLESKYQAALYAAQASEREFKV